MKDTITNEDICRAFDALRQSDDFERERREQRRLKDFSKLEGFYKKLKESNLSEIEKAQLSHVIEMLAQGYYLVMGEKVFALISAELRELAVPEEVISNIFVSTNLKAHV